MDEIKWKEQGLRLQIFYRSLHLSGKAFANHIQQSQSLISATSRGRKPITHILVNKITQCYPDFNEGWLRTGLGEMQFTNKDDSNSPVQENKERDATINALHNMIVENETRIEELENAVERIVELLKVMRK